MNKLLAITSVLLLAGGMATSASAQSRDYQGYQGYSNGYDQGDEDGDEQGDDQGDDNSEYDDNGDRNGNGYDRYSQSDDRYGDGQRQLQYDRNDNRSDDGDERQGRRKSHGNGHDSRDFGHSHQARHRYQAGRYAAPRGYRGNRWNVGTRLPAGYYGSSHYLDARNYGLGYPSRGYRWNRVGNDAYMVSTSNGLIRDVVYSLFR